jgi:hypothetical protein
MDASIYHPSLAQPWGGTVAISDYTRLAPAARAYGRARVRIPRDHPLITDTAITGLRGVLVTIDQALLGGASYLQIGKPSKQDWGWDLDCFEISYLLKLLRVPVQTRGYGNLPAGVIARMALDAALGLAAVPIVAGSFVEAAPLVESYSFTGQTIDDVFQDLMTATGQEWEITPTGVVNWVSRVGTYRETVLTEGYDFCLLDFDEAEDAPVGAVVVTDQNGNTSDTWKAREHARDLTARTIALRADTTSATATNLLAESLLNEGRIVRTVARIGLYPQGGSMSVTIPGPGDAGDAVGFPLMGGGFVLMGGGFTLYGGSGGGGVTAIDMDWPTFAAPNWQIRPGDTIRIIAPSAGVRGDAGLYRVRGITYGDQHLYPILDLLQEPHWTTETLPLARRLVPAATAAPRTLERMITEPQKSQGPLIDTARLRSQLSPVQVPVLSSLNGTATAAQVPPLQNLTGAVTAAQVPSGGTVADAAADPTQAEFNALTAALRTAGVID